MEQIRLKLMMAGAGVLVSLVMIVGGTFAWFTVSQKPEITGISVTMAATGKEYPFELSLNGEQWTTELYVDSQLMGKGPLRPISTADLVHWYLPEYYADGGVAAFNEVELADVANRGEELTSYLVYFDLWVRTRDPDATYALKLNNPGKNSDGSLHVESQETVFGTYALWLPQWNPTTGKYENPKSANDAMACLRIGFQVLDENDQIQNTFIFEPNADMRSTIQDDGNLGDVAYVYGSPVVNDYGGSFREGSMYNTSVPTWSAEGEYTMTVQQTFRQRKSSWNAGRLAALQENQAVDSRCIQTVGAFVGESPDMAHISIEKSQKLRIFIWLEGQDIDCWNQIAGGGIFANLEFRGDEVS